jgi:hypothetical protein
MYKIFFIRKIAKIINNKYFILSNSSSELKCCKNSWTISKFILDKILLLGSSNIDKKIGIDPIETISRKDKKILPRNKKNICVFSLNERVLNKFLNILSINYMILTF